MLMEIIVMFIFRGLPESFIHMYAMYRLNNVQINRKKYIYSSVLLSASMILITNLPISYGIHTLLVMMSLISLAVIMNGLRIEYCISIGILNAVIQFMAEGMNILLIQKVFRKEMASVMSDPITSIIYGIPSILTFWGIIWILGKINSRVQGKKNV